MVRTKHHIVNENRPRVAVYARFSCDKQRDESIEDQVYEAERYCEAHDYEIVHVYTDYALSGRSDERPQFKVMLEDAKAGAFDLVLVWKMDRFARNMQDQFYYEKLLNDCGIWIESIKENIAGNGIEASMSKGMHAIFAQIRSQESAQDTMRGMLGKARKCQYLGYYWFGYAHDGDEITLDPASHEVAYEIHSRYLAGHAVKDIVKWLNSQGVTNRNGQQVGYTFVTGILKNLCYAGIYTWGKKKDEHGNMILDAEGSPVPLVYVEDGIPAIVTREMKAQCLKRLGYHKHANTKADYLLSGKLFCSKCGHAMHGEMCRDKQQRERFRYVCRDQRRACSGVYWKDETETAIARSVRNAFADPATVERIAEIFVQYRSKKKPAASIEAAKADLKQIRKQRDNLVKAVEDGMPYKHVKEKLEALDAQQAGIERKIEELNHTEREISKADVLQMLSMVADGLRTDAEILNAFVSQVWLEKERAIAVMAFDHRDSTPYEIACAVPQLESAQFRADSSNIALVPPVGL